MKKSRLFAVLAIASLTLTGCGGNEDTSSTAASSSQTSVASIPTIKLSEIGIEAKADFTYDISIKLDTELPSGTNAYISSNSKYDSSDTKVTLTGSAKDYTFTYNSNLSSFYILLVNGSDVYGKQNISLPAINASIVTNGTKDDISFNVMNDGRTLEEYFVADSLTVYRSSSSTLDKNSATKVVTSGSASSTYSVDSADGEKYFFMEYMTSTKISYTSQAFTKDEAFGSGIATFSSLEISSEGVMSIGGKLNKTVSNPRLYLCSAGDGTQDSVLISPDASNNFTTTLDLTKLTDTENSYQLYLLLAPGIFTPVPGFLSSTYSKITSEKVFSASSTSCGLFISYKDKAAVTVLEASLIKEEGVVYFTTNGLFDESLAGVTISNAALIIDNDQNDSTDTCTYPLTIDAANKTYSVKAPLAKMAKLGSWYNVKIWLNTDEGSEPTYEYLKTDCTNYDASLKDDASYKKFSFQSYNDFLKIYYDDVSSYISSWTYIKKEGKIFLRLEGLDASENITSNYVTIYPEGGTDDNLHKANCVRGTEADSFYVDIPCDDIPADTKYQVHWVHDGNNSEITNKNIAKPTSVLASDDGYIFCVKSGSWNDTYWWKVYKDSDAAKANDVAFAKETDKNTFTLKGAVNSAYKDKALYVQYGILDGTAFTNCLYSTVTVSADLIFTSTLDLTNVSKNSNYEARLVTKDGDTYTEIPSGANEFCGFYNEYLPSDFSSKTLVTDSGTYHVNTYTDNTYTLYIYCD